jgi:periplasmic protein TonB
MRTPVLRTTPSSESQAWITRVRENFRQLLTPTGLSPSSSNGAPIHLLKLDRSGRAGGAQTVSLLTHAGILLALAFFAVQSRTIKPLAGALIETARERLTFAPPTDTILSRPSLGRNGGGGDDNPVPATHGFLPPRSSIQLAQPRLPDNLDHSLPVPVTILDAQAPPILAPTSNLGLPWMPKDTNSGGPGKNGMGSGKNGGMGDRDGSDAGEGIGRPYAPGISSPICLVCPYPIYTDEARHVKVQGTVTLQVLVGADGKAAEIRVLRGVGYGLEERAVETVRGWKFKPARDAAQRPVAAWVTIEAVFRLF